MFRRIVVCLLILLLCVQPVLAVQELPPALPQEPVSPPQPVYDPVQKELADGLAALTPELGEQPVYLTEPQTRAPYAMGELNPVYLQTGLDYVNYVRALAGLAPVGLSEHLCVQAQYGAVVLATGDVLTHTPEKPADMDASFFRLGANACAGGNLSMRFLYQHDSLLQSALRGHLDEDSALNRLDLGHRRWLLDPKLGQIGFGLATSVSGKQYIVVPIWDATGTGDSPAEVCWPAAGQFPNSLFTPGTPWSVSLDPTIYAIPDESLLQVQVTRLSDGAVFVPALLDSRETLDNEGTYLLVSNKAYGTGACVSFSIGKNDLGQSAYLGDYRVDIRGLQKRDGSESPLTYTVRFFDPAHLSAPASWAEEEWTAAARLDLIPASLTDLYDHPITRLEFCRLAMQTLRQLTGLDNEGLVTRYALAEAPAPFTDCTDPDVLAAAAIGAVRGMGDGTFRPGNSILREDAAVLLMQSATALGLTAETLPELIYADADGIREYARPAVAWASALVDQVSQKPVMEGVGEGRFDPQGHYTREQAVLTLLRLFRSGGIVPDEPDVSPDLPPSFPQITPPVLP